METATTVGLIALFAGLTTFFVLYAIYAPVVKKEEKNAIQTEVFGEQVETYEAGDSLGKYVRPVLNNFLPQMPTIPLSEERKKSLQSLIVKSGNPWHITSEEFVGLMVALGIFGVLVGSAITALGVLPAFLPPIVLIIFMGAVGFLLPYTTYNTRKESRTKAIEKELPEALDLLTITIASGQAFEFALENIIRQLPEGILRTEFGKVVVELQAGSTLERSLTDFSRKFESSDLESFTRAVIQTSRLGSDVTETLTQQADFVRSNYEARIEAMISRLETTMFIPLIITMLPAFMIIFIAPTLASISDFLF
jgi:tight adherence protein C